MTRYQAVFVCSVLLLLTLSLSSALGETMSVQVKETQVRVTPSFLGRIITTLSYGARVEILEQGKGWFKIAIPEGGGEGWVSESALSEKRIVLKAGAENVSSGASSSEVALAGKGFNEQVEAQYKAETDLDYAWVDRMEEIAFPPDELVAFLVDGKLGGAE